MTTITNEIELLQASLKGNKEAFGAIVEHYQLLICSITYCATGNFTKSEELAQETFIRAWKELKQLRDLSKFRAWLCTIARNLIRHTIKKQSKDAIDTSKSIESIADFETSEPAPDDVAITKEQQNLIWRTLQEIPETYREPMVLFYRKQQSIKQVAAELDLSEEVTKQRLSRGRKLLKAEMSSLVEDILGKTTPKKAFTVGVIAALPSLSPKAASAAVAGAATKGTNTAAFSVLSNFLGMLITPILVWWGNINLHKASIEDAKTERERSFIRRRWIVALLYCSLWPVMILLLIFTNLRRYGYLILLLFPLFFVGILVLGFSGRNKLKTLQIEEGTYIEPEKRVRSKRRIYGELSFIFGWLMILNFIPIKAHDQFAVWFNIIGAIVIFIMSTQMSLNKQQHYNRIIYAATAAIGILALLIYNLRWHKWIIEIPKYQKYPLWKVNIFIITATLVIILLMVLSAYYQKYRRKFSSIRQTE